MSRWLAPFVAGVETPFVAGTGVDVPSRDRFGSIDLTGIVSGAGGVAEWKSG